MTGRNGNSMNRTMLCLMTALLAGAAAAQPVTGGGPMEALPGMGIISQEELLHTVRYLASRELAGRLSGDPGYNKAAEFMAKEFGALHLKALGEDGYYQYFNVQYNEILPPLTFSRVREGGSEKVYVPGSEYVCRGLTGTGTLTAPVVFCGYGISRTGYDDYAGMDLKGKIALVFKQNPGWQLDTTGWGNGYPRAKALIAAQRGARAILFVSLPNDKTPQKTIVSVLEGSGVQDEEFPELHVDIPVADEFLVGTGFTLKALQTAIDSTKKPHSVAMKSSAHLEVHARYQKEKRTMNVVGLLEGTDPSLKDDYVVIGAHLDHVGSQAGLIYAPGANDNASGSAAVLQLARAFVLGGEKMSRSVIFILFACEEQGLFGSSHFVNHPPVPLEKISAMINMDCIGFGDSIQVGNGKSSPTLWALVRREDSLSSRMMVQATWNGGGADAGPFHQKGVPAAYFVTTNSYVHLHDVTDTPETLNGPLFEKVARLAYRTARAVASGGYVREVVKP
jgi:aminopeptidase YwaD